MIPGVPYDWEVEYLEADGTQYVDTGLVPDGGTDLWVKASFADPVGPQAILGGGDAWMDNELLIYLGTSQSKTSMVVRRGGSGVTMDGGYIGTDVHEYEISGGKLYFDGTEESGNVFVSGLDTSVTVALFATHRTAGYGNLMTGRIYGCMLSSSGKVLRSLVPVRFTNELGVSEGAMFDRVTRRLFRNVGTGSFVVGPDVRRPVMGLHMYGGGLNEN